MGHSDGRKTFQIGFAALIQYWRVSDTQPPSQTRCRSKYRAYAQVKICGRSGLHPEPHWELTALPRPVMWSETVGLRTTGLRPKKSVLVLVLQVLCCVVKYNLVTPVVVMILEDTTAFQVIV